MRTSATSLAIACWAVLYACSEHAARAADPSDLGRIGPVWPIAEPDLLESMRRKAAAKITDGDVERLQEELDEKSRRYASAPPSLNLPRAGRSRSWRLDPTITVPDDVLDADGRVLIPAGTRVNPLDYRSLSHTLVFVDAADVRQLAWLERELASTDNAKLILTGGSPAEVAQRLDGHAVYFDQHGELVGALGIGEVPTTVAQDRRHLRLRSYGPEDLP